MVPESNTGGSDRESRDTADRRERGRERGESVGGREGERGGEARETVTADKDEEGEERSSRRRRKRYVRRYRITLIVLHEAKTHQTFVFPERTKNNDNRRPGSTEELHTTMLSVSQSTFI